MRRWRAWAGRSSTPPAPMCPAYTRSSPALRRGRQVLIIGTRTHPEVAAIAGWCRRPVVLEGWRSCRTGWKPRRNGDIPLTMVSQTTSTRFIWDSCVEKAKKSVQT
ncbi:MAG: hypothetical protein ACLRIS_03560 [Flavonifractor plautii]